MKIKEIINKALPMAMRHAPHLADRLVRLQSDSAESTLKVVVLGDFKSGRSALLNRMFLQQNLLPENMGAKSIIVPVHLCAGNRRLRAWTYAEDGDDSPMEELVDFSADDILSRVAANPTDLDAFTLQKCSKIELRMPDILPEGLSLVYPPGLDSPHQPLQEVAMREAENADAVLYVKNEKQLAKREVELLRHFAGAQRDKVPVHVVLTKAYKQDEDEGLRQEIESQLVLAHVPCGVSILYLEEQKTEQCHIANEIELESVWDIDDDALWGVPSKQSTAAPKAETKKEQVAWDDGELWGDGESLEKQIPDEIPNPGDADSDGVPIRERLLEYFNGEVKRGRNSRLTRELMPILLQLKDAIENRMQLAEASENELTCKEEELKIASVQYFAQQKRIFDTVNEHQRKMLRNIDRVIDENLMSGVLEDIERKGNISDIKRCYSDWSNKLNNRLTGILKAALNDYNDGVERYCKELCACKAGDQIDIKTDESRLLQIVNKTPMALIWITDWCISSAIIPGPAKVDLVVRIAADFIPHIKEFTPKALLTRSLRLETEAAVRKTCSKAKDTIHARMSDFFKEQHEKAINCLPLPNMFDVYKKAIDERRNGYLSKDDCEICRHDLTEIEQWKLLIH